MTLLILKLFSPFYFKTLLNRYAINPCFNKINTLLSRLIKKIILHLDNFKNEQ